MQEGVRETEDSIKESVPEAAATAESDVGLQMSPDLDSLQHQLAVANQQIAEQQVELAAARRPASTHPSFYDRVQPNLVTARNIFIANLWAEQPGFLIGAFGGDLGSFTDLAKCIISGLYALVLLLGCAGLRTYSGGGDAHARKILEPAQQVLVGWQIKAFVTNIQNTLNTFVATNGDSNSQLTCLAWTCLFSATVALCVTPFAVATAHLPTTPKTGFRAHVATLVIGATALPLGAVWNNVHKYINFVVAGLIFQVDSRGVCMSDPPLPASTNVSLLINGTSSSSGSDDDEVGPRWIVITFLGILAIAVWLAAVSCAKARLEPFFDQNEARLSSEERHRRCEIIRRARTLSFQTFDFLVAYGLWDVISSIWEGYSFGGCCDAASVVSLMDGTAMQLSFVIAAYLVACGSSAALPPPSFKRCCCASKTQATTVQVSGAQTVEKVMPNADNVAPPPRQRPQVGPIARGILTKTLGIQLGWAIKAFFDALNYPMAVVTVLGLLGMVTHIAGALWHHPKCHCLPAMFV